MKSQYKKQSKHLNIRCFEFYKYSIDRVEFGMIATYQFYTNQSKVNVMFKTAKFNRISSNIVEQIHSAILNGALKPGDRLPPEKELAEKFDVSKASLREAFRALEALGLLEVRQGVSGGAFVREVELETAQNCVLNYIFFQNPSIGEFTQLRTMLEPPMAEMAARTFTDENIAQLAKNLQETETKLKDSTFYYDLDIEFHHQIASAANNLLICFVIDTLKNAIVNVKLELQLDQNFSEKVFQAHKRIYEAICDRDPEGARAAMLKHIEEVDTDFVSHCRPNSQLKP